VSASGEAFSPTGGRVAEVNYREGSFVHKGDVLIRLDTERLDKEIAKHDQAATAAAQELAQIARLEKVLPVELEAAIKKAEAELEHATQEVEQSKRQKAVELALAEETLKNASEEESKYRAAHQ